MSGTNKQTTFIQGKPVPQPRQRARAILPSLSDLAQQLPRSGPKSLRQWIQRKTISQLYVPSDHPVQAWKQAVALCWRNRTGTMIKEGPIGVKIVFVRPRPKSITRKTKPNPAVWDAACVGDADNLAKAVLDALGGIAFKNDAQVSKLIVHRTIAAEGEKAGCYITIWPLKSLSQKSRME